MKESKILCEHDKSMAKFLEFPVYSNLPPAIASDVSWAQTIFSTECVGEYFKSDEYQKFIEKNENKSFDSKDPTMLRAVAAHELFETLHCSTASMVPRLVRAQAVLRYISKSMPILISEVSLLDTVITRENGYLLGLGMAVHSYSQSVTKLDPKSEATTISKQLPIQLMNWNNKALWLSPVGEGKNLCVAKLESPTSKDLMKIQISFSNWTTIIVLVEKSND